MRRSRLLQLVDAAVLALACALVGIVGSAWALRLPHPYDLEWMEGGMLAHAWRVQQGLSLYPPPGPEFVPFVYPPGYPLVLAGLGGLFELSHPLGRALAIAGTLGAAAALAVGVARHGRHVVVGLGAAAMFLGTWPDSGAFFDLVRPDALSLAFLAWALVLGLERGRGAAVASGLLLAAAWACKHNAAAYGLAMWLGIALRDGWRRGLLFAASAALPALGATLVLQGLTEGRFVQYVLGVPASHPMVGRRVFPGAPAELVQILPVALATATVGLFLRARRALGLAPALLAAIGGVGALVGIAAFEPAPWPRGIGRPERWALWIGGGALGAGLALSLGGLGAGLRRRRLPWSWVYGGGVALTALVTAALMRGHHGGFLNVLMPMHWVAAFGVGLVVARWRSDARAPVMGGFAVALLAGQLGLQLWDLDTERLLPTDADRAAGDAVVERLEQRCEGPVLSPHAAWLPVQAGFEPSVHLIALWDIDHAGGPFRDEVARIHEAAAAQRWDCVVQGGRRPLGFGISEHYRRAERLPVEGRALMPRTGWRVRPDRLLTPAPRGGRGSGDAP